MPYKFEKNNVYLTRAIADAIMADFPGRYASKKSCMTAISKSITKLGLGAANRQRRFRGYAGKDAQAIYDDILQTARSLPLEAAVKAAETEEVIEIFTADQVSKSEITDEDLESYAREHYPRKDVMTPDTIGLVMTSEGAVPVLDPFARRRKNFYTDVKYFLKDAQSSEERVAIWHALASLYSYIDRTEDKNER